MLKKIIGLVTVLLIYSIGYAIADTTTNQVVIVNNRVETISNPLISANNNGVLAQYVRKNAPSDYTVKKNDTVLKIASMYLTKSGLWPQLLGVRSLKDTRLYVGDKLHLLTLDGNKVLVVDHLLPANAREYEKLTPEVRETTNAELPPISTKKLENLFMHPSMMPPGVYESLPKVIGGSNPGEMYYTTGSTVYVKGYDGQTGDRVTIYSKFRQIIDPDSKENLGNEVRYDGDGIVTQVGPISIITINSSVNEITDLDRISVQRDQIVPDIIPHLSSQIITGKIVGMYETLTSTAEDNSVIINRGSRDGVEVGQVYDITDTHKIIDPDSNPDKPHYLVMPPQTIGELLIYKVYDKVAFGVITDSSAPILLYSVVQSQ